MPSGGYLIHGTNFPAALSPEFIAKLRALAGGPPVADPRVIARAFSQPVTGAFAGDEAQRADEAGREHHSDSD